MSSELWSSRVEDGRRHACLSKLVENYPVVFFAFIPMTFWTFLKFDFWNKDSFHVYNGWKSKKKQIHNKKVVRTVHEERKYLCGRMDDYRILYYPSWFSDCFIDCTLFSHNLLAFNPFGFYRIPSIFSGFHLFSGCHLIVDTMILCMTSLISHSFCGFFT